MTLQCGVVVRIRSGRMLLCKYSFLKKKKNKYFFSTAAKQIGGKCVVIIICARLPRLSGRARTDAARRCKWQGRSERTCFFEISDTLARIKSDLWEQFGW